MANKIMMLIAEARIEEALEELKKHPKYQTDRQFQNQVIMTSSRLSSSQRQEMMGLIPLDAAMREKNHISQAILAMADRFGIGENDGEEPNPHTPPPPIPESEQREGAPRILFLASDPRGMGKLQLEKEYVKIHTQLGDSAPEFNLKIKFEPRADTLTKTLLEDRPTFVHFAGHGVGAADDFHPAGIVLEDRQGNANVVPGTALANMFRLIKKKIDVKAVVLNACESEEQAKAISAHDIYAVGMTKEIPDKMAISFAGGFYLGLAESPDDIPFAFEMAINNLLMENIAGEKVPKLFFQGEEVTF
ncbi:MAG: CHAT domain-containing protein [Lewinella sp.]